MDNQEAVVLPDPFSFKPTSAPQHPPVTTEEEIEALRKCVTGLEPIANDRSALRRIYDYLQQKFPATRSPKARDDF